MNQHQPSVDLVSTQCNHVLSNSGPKTHFMDLKYMPLQSELQEFENTMDSHLTCSVSSHGLVNNVNVNVAPTV